MHARHAAIVLALLPLLCVLPTGAPQAPPPPALRLAEVLPSPDAAAGQREFVEISNEGEGAVSLEGWRIEDAATSSGSVNGFTFPDLILAAGARIVVWSNGSGDARGPAWSTSPSKTVWNDAGDAATLLDPAGHVVDWMAYGTTAATAPAGYEALARPDAPPRGASLALADGAWGEGQPSPGLAPGEHGGTVGADVQNVAPRALVAAPATAKPRESVRLTLSVEDGNGEADVAAWSLRSGTTVLASGNRTPPAAVDLRAPGTAGPWLLEFHAQDKAGASGRANATVQVREAAVDLTLPPSGGLRFPGLLPGQRNTTSVEPFVVRNDGPDPLPLLIDVSPFSGAGSTIPVEGNLWVGVGDGNATPAWTQYERPLQPLATLAPGESRYVWLRIGTVPSPLPAGSYGTSFTVVPA